MYNHNETRDESKDTLLAFSFFRFIIRGGFDLFIQYFPDCL